jgi:hypothetical protein
MGIFLLFLIFMLEDHHNSQQRLCLFFLGGPPIPLYHTARAAKAHQELFATIFHFSVFLTKLLGFFSILAKDLQYS